MGFSVRETIIRKRHYGGLHRLQVIVLFPGSIIVFLYNIIWYYHVYLPKMFFFKYSKTVLIKSKWKSTNFNNLLYMWTFLLKWLSNILRYMGLQISLLHDFFDKMFLFLLFNFYTMKRNREILRFERVLVTSVVMEIVNNRMVPSWSFNMSNMLKL